MKTLSLLLAGTVLAVNVALAADPIPGNAVRPAGEIVKPGATPVVKADARSAAGVVDRGGYKPTATTPQNRMKECNKAATGKRGAERKTFMKGCLSSRKG